MLSVKTSAGLFLASFLVLSFTFTYAHGQGATGSATITATCGLALNDNTLTFGSIAKDGQSGVDAVQVNFTNTGSVTSSVTVNGNNWLDGSAIIHIGGNYTKFATTDQGPEGVAYTAKNPLNVTNSDVTFGVVKTSPFVNETYWQLQATLQNLPFSGSLTQTITFTGVCLS